MRRGDLIACGAFGRASLEARPGAELLAAQAAYERACAAYAALCDEATAAWREETAEHAAIRRRLLESGCARGDLGSCMGLRRAWLEGPGADLALVLDASERACALSAGACLRLGLDLLRTADPADWARGRALLAERVRSGDDEAAADLVAIRFGGPENLPPRVRVAWESCRVPRGPGCAELASFLEDPP